MESKVTIGKGKSQDVGEAGLQTRTNARKARNNNLPQRDPHHRKWTKSPSLKGLGEIEEIENEEISTKMMQSLERFMRSYPAVWTESSVQHLLVEIADTRYASAQNSEAEARLQTIINRILVPMANIMEAEQRFMMVERQKIQEATLALQRVQEECHLALGDLKQEHDLASRDLRELATALEENRMAAEEARTKLDSKEKQIHDMLQKQSNLVTRLVCGGPAEFLAWAREEIQFRGLDDLNGELEHAWGGTQLVPVDKMLVPVSDQCSHNSPAKKEWKDPKVGGEKSNLGQWTSVTVKLLCVVGLEVVGQLGDSYDSVHGPLSLPSAVAGFWLGMTRRMTFLAVATMFPQLAMQNTQPVATTGIPAAPKSAAGFETRAPVSFEIMNQ